MQIEDFADQWAFVAQALDMPVPAARTSDAAREESSVANAHRERQRAVR
jgi:hypothetical protein